MPFSYHAPTSSYCPICEQLSSQQYVSPLIDTYSARASAANNFPFHNWYNFVLGYTPDFPDFLIKRENLKSTDFVVDPFMGSGTTLISCKWHGIPSSGVDANDFMLYAADTKLDWNRDLASIRVDANKLLVEVHTRFSQYNWEAKEGPQMNKITAYAESTRPKMLTERYMSNKPFVKAVIIKKTINEIVSEENKKLFQFALSTILVKISNVSYGPGFGVKKAKDDVDVYSAFESKLRNIISDLGSVDDKQRNTLSSTYLGDSRHLEKIYDKHSISYMITSPPYPGDHEYTKYTRLELIFDNMASDLKEFRVIKKRMVRASTTNVYKEDSEGHLVSSLESIQKVTNLIEERLKRDNATSGFEKLYTKSVWEYFGGMLKFFKGVHETLKDGGKISLLVSDSHAFKMVHIQTAAILAEVAELAGLKDPRIELWQYKKSTSHHYDFRENILTLTNRVE